MQTIYVGKSRKIGDIDLKRNRIYLERPDKIIENLKEQGHSLADKLFVPIDKINDALKAVETPGTPEFIANSKI